IVVLSLADGSTRTLWSAPTGVNVTSVAVSPEGASVGAGTGEGTLVVVDVSTGQLRWSASGHEGPVSHVAWSPDGRWLASGSIDRTVRLWDAPTGQLRRTMSAGNGSARSVVFSSD